MSQRRHRKPPADDPAARERARDALHAAIDRGDDPEKAARDALRVSSECVDAWLLLADFATSAVEARDRVRRAVEVATHVLGEAGLREGRGRLGATADGAAYLHALAALARHQVGEDRAAQAIQTLHGLLAMDPTDPVQARGDLLLLLLAEARDDEAEALVAAYPEEASAEWMYGRALAKRRRALDDDALARATAALDRAVSRFPAAGRAIAGEDGVLAADPVVRDAWTSTDGAIAWLVERMRAAGKASADTSSAAARAAATRAADRRYSAREHVEEAWEATGAKREELARAALELWPDCADAWRALATAALDRRERVERLREAVAAGARAIGRDPSAGTAFPAGDSEDALSYLRARAALAAALREAGDADGALVEERRLVAEDADDATGAAVPFVGRLLAAGLDEEARAILARREEDAAPGWAWARVLERRRAGDRVATSFALSEAMLVAPLAAPLLCAGRSKMPRPESAGSLDAWEEARRAAAALAPAWEATPGAIDWLRDHLPRPAPRGRGSPPRGRRPT